MPEAPRDAINWWRERYLEAWAAAGNVEKQTALPELGKGSDSKHDRKNGTTGHGGTRFTYWFEFQKIHEGAMVNSCTVLYRCTGFHPKP